MKTLRKIIPIMLLTGALSSCSTYNAKPGKLKNLVGTYELSVYEMKHEDSEEQERYDRKKEIGAVAYFSVDEEGYGYYAYKDEKTPARVDQVFSRFFYDKDNPELIEKIEQTDGVTDVKADKQVVGCLDESPMGFRDELFKKTLGYTLLGGHMIGQPDAKIHWQHVVYKRVSKEASLDKVNQLMGTEAKFQYPFELKSAGGYLVYRCQPKEGSEIGIKNGYEYAILDMKNFANNKAKIYYSLKENPGQQEVEVEFSVKEKALSTKATIFGSEFHSEGLGLSFSTDWDGEKEITWESFSRADYPSDITLAELISAEKTK